MGVETTYKVTAGKLKDHAAIDALTSEKFFSPAQAFSQHPR
jgi:hypothetical protein